MNNAISIACSVSSFPSSSHSTYPPGWIFRSLFELSRSCAWHTFRYECLCYFYSHQTKTTATASEQRNKSIESWKSELSLKLLVECKRAERLPFSSNRIVHFSSSSKSLCIYSQVNKNRIHYKIHSEDSTFLLVRISFISVSYILLCWRSLFLFQICWKDAIMHMSFGASSLHYFFFSSAALCYLRDFIRITYFHFWISSLLFYIILSISVSFILRRRRRLQWWL